MNGNEHENDSSPYQNTPPKRKPPGTIFPNQKYHKSQNILTQTNVKYSI